MTVKDDTGKVTQEAKTVTTQQIALGPVASQVAIKMLGSNGGGFFNANGAHPFENPTPFSNLLQIISILLIARRIRLYLRRHGRRPPAGLDADRGHDGDFYSADGTGA